MTAGSSLLERKVRHVFALCDQNDDGILDDSDFVLWFQRLAAIRGYQPGSAEHADLAELFLVAFRGVHAAYGDERGLPVDAACDALIAIGRAGGPELARWGDGFFDLVDADGDGVIGPAEYRDLMATVSVDAEVADAAFAKLDLDGDGHISRDESRALYVEFFTSDDPEAPGNLFWGPFD